MRAQLIISDNPWDYNDRKATRKDNPAKAPKFGIGVQRRYTNGVIKTEDLCKLPVPQISTSNVYHFMWTTAAHLPDSLRVMEAWGLKYRTVAFVWEKIGVHEDPENDDGVIVANPGSYTLSNAEFLLLGRPHKAKCWHDSSSGCAKLRQVVRAPRIYGPDGKIIHSRKPDIFFELIERWLFPQKIGIALELFATQPRPGWVCLGGDVTGNDIREDLRTFASRGY